MIMIRYIYVFGVSNVLISSFKSPPHAHPLFFMYNLRFGAGKWYSDSLRAKKWLQVTSPMCHQLVFLLIGQNSNQSDFLAQVSSWSLSWERNAHNVFLSVSLFVTDNSYTKHKCSQMRPSLPFPVQQQSDSIYQSLCFRIWTKSMPLYL